MLFSIKWLILSVASSVLKISPFFNSVPLFAKSRIIYFDMFAHRMQAILWSVFFSRYSVKSLVTKEISDSSWPVNRLLNICHSWSEIFSLTVNAAGYVRPLQTLSLITSCLFENIQNITENQIPASKDITTDTLDVRLFRSNS